MGNESSTPVAENVPPVRLYARTIEAVADYVKSHDVKRVVVMTGAGISTSAGIPDFRSPETGLYANLARLNLPYAEAVFDISYFKTNPRPFYELAHELYPGQFRPTVTHSFLSLLQEKGMLLKVFTQNIDCLEREAGVSGDKIIEAHGSFATQRCIECKTEYPGDKMKENVAQKSVPHCVRSKCDGLVKPDIVFFGEALPEAFHRDRGLPATADLAIVMGTSLTVQPFASLPQLVSEDTPRLLINLERVGGLGSRPDDVVLLEDCDAGVRRFADALGWRDELETNWAATNPKKAEETKAAHKQLDNPPKDEQEILDEKIRQLTEGVDKTLKLSETHQKQFEEDFKSRPDAANLQVPKPSDDAHVVDNRTGKGESQVSERNSRTDDLSHIYPHIDSKTAEKPSL